MANDRIRFVSIVQSGCGELNEGALDGRGVVWFTFRCELGGETLELAVDGRNALIMREALSKAIEDLRVRGSLPEDEAELIARAKQVPGKTLT